MNYPTSGSGCGGYAGISGVEASNDGACNESIVTFSGGDQPHNNMQPYLVINYIIKF